MTSDSRMVQTNTSGNVGKMGLSSEDNNRGKKKSMGLLQRQHCKHWEAILECLVILFPFPHLFSSPVYLNNNFLAAVTDTGK